MKNFQNMSDQKLDEYIRKNRPLTELSDEELDAQISALRGETVTPEIEVTEPAKVTTPSLTSMRDSFQQDIPFGSTAGLGLRPGEQFKDEETIGKIATEAIVPAAQIAATIAAPELTVPAMLLNALKVTGVTSMAAPVRDVLKGKEIDPIAIGKESVKEGLLHSAIGSVFKLAAKTGSVGNETWQKVNEFAAEHGLPSVMNKVREKLTLLGRATVFGEQQFQKYMREFTENVSTFIGKELGDKTAATPLLSDTIERITDMLNARKSYVQLDELIGSETPINMQKFYAELDPLIDELDAVFSPETADMLRKAKAAFNKGGLTDLPFAVVDGMITDLKKSMKPGSHETIMKTVGKLRESIGQGVRNADPETVARVEATGKTIEELITASDVDYAKIQKAIKADKTGTLRKWAYGKIQESKFLMQWSQSKAARDLYRKADPETAKILDESWLGKNVERYLFTVSKTGEKTLVNNGEGLRGFMQQEKKNVIDMFGDEGYETIINFSHYLDASKQYIGKQTPTNFVADLMRVAGSTGVGGTVGRTGSAAAGLDPTVGGWIGAIGALFTAEGIGYTLVNQMLKPNSITNTIFGKVVSGTVKEVAKRPSLLGGPLGFEEERPGPSLNLNAQ